MAERCPESREAAPSICVLYRPAAATLSNLYSPRGISYAKDKLRADPWESPICQPLIYVNLLIRSDG